MRFSHRESTHLDMIALTMNSIVDLHLFLGFRIYSLKSLSESGSMLEVNYGDQSRRKMYIVLYFANFRIQYTSYFLSMVM
jgi:hypothetical protein